MPQLPQIVRERLKALPPLAGHPDPNVLTAFSEQLLPESERAMVLEHLARCGDCRDVVALALPVSEVADVAAARTAHRGWFGWPSVRWGLVAAIIVAATSIGIQQFRVHQRANVTIAQVMSRGQETNAPTQTQGPQSQLVVPPVLPRDEGAVKADAVLSNKPATAETKVLPRAGHGDSAGASAAVASGAGLVVPRPNSKLTMAAPPRDLPFAQDWRKSMSPAMAKQVPAPPPSRETPPPVSEMVEVQSQSGQNTAQSESEAQSLQGRNAGEAQISAERADVVERAKPPLAHAGTPAAVPARTARWTISSAGSLQRSLDGGNTWQEVAVVTNDELVASSLTRESVAKPQADKSEKARSRDDKKSQIQTISTPVFRAVAADGLEVWAGGSGGALYHSGDGGEHWTGVLPAAEGVVLKGDITSIQFSDPQRGKVSTSSPEVWTTNDGGQSWQKQN